MGKKEEHNYKRKAYTRFDGEGLISPSYAEFLNKRLKATGAVKDKNDHASSFQIRMPFIKGVLHEVDFQGFFEEQFSIAGLNPNILEKIYIKDIFGRNRELKQVQIILTQSMFKCYDWLKDPQKLSKKNCVHEDIMQSYFERFTQYDHALYIGNTDCNLSRNYDFEKIYPCRRGYLKDKNYHLSRRNTIKLNYQFLHTLDMDQESFEKLVEKHLERSRNLLNERREQVLRILDNSVEPFSGENEACDEEGENRKICVSGWQAALARNSHFISHDKIYGEVREAKRSLIKDVGVGRIEVEGSLMFLSHDLLALLEYIIENMVIDSEACDEETSEWMETKDILTSHSGGKKKRKGKSLWNFCLKKNEFYAADQACLETAGDIVDEWKGYYGILRSPHLSREEQCILKSRNLSDQAGAGEQILMEIW